MSAKKTTILIAFTVLFIFSVISRIFFNDFQDGWIAYEKKDFKTARELWLPLAEQGESRAQFFLGFMHDMGFGVPEDDKQALKWYLLAAEQGDSRAQLFTGYLYDLGRGVQDHQKALKWYKLAAKQGYKQAKKNIYELAKNNALGAWKILVNDAENGNSDAQYILAQMYETGQGVRQDYVEAVKWYRMSVEHDNGNAKKNIYKLAKKGIPEALKVLLTDAENGDPNTLYTLGKMYELGEGVQKDYEKATKWYVLLSTKGKKRGNIQEEAKAILYRLAKWNVSEALKILVNDAENGNATAQRNLSFMYQLGLGVPQDYHESVKWYGFQAERELAKAKKYINSLVGNVPLALKSLNIDAENGDTEAQMKLALMYHFGLNVPKDYKKAAVWYRSAALQGVNNAQFIMGLIYTKGQGVPQDDREAINWYQLAAKRRISAEKMSIYNMAVHKVPQAKKILTDDAENGIAVAQYKLGSMYANGSGVTYDLVLAYMWYNLSALQGHEAAVAQISLLEEKMSPQQIERAQEMVENWKPSE